MGEKKNDKKNLNCYDFHNIAEETQGKNLAEPSAMPINTSSIYDKKIWKVDDVAKFLGCSKGHIYNLSSDEKIPKIKKGKFLYFVPSEILEWLLQGET